MEASPTLATAHLGAPRSCCNSQPATHNRHLTFTSLRPQRRGQPLGIMYITPEVFRPPPFALQRRPWTTMDIDQEPALGKRKRDKNESEDPALLQDITPTKISRIHKPNESSHAPWTSTPTISSGHRPMKQLKRTIPKITVPTTASAPPVHSSSDLRACHICHSAPKRKRDLENYLECESCAQRACFICARECAGGCRKQLCSRCSVEVGRVGDTYCLGCFQARGA